MKSVEEEGRLIDVVQVLTDWLDDATAMNPRLRGHLLSVVRWAALSGRLSSAVH